MGIIPKTTIAAMRKEYILQKVVKLNGILWI